MVLKKSKRLQKMAMNVNQDQNFSVHLDGVKTRGSTIQKNRGGALEGKKAPNDISNSGKRPAINTSRKQNPKNVIPIGEDVGVPKKALSVKPVQSQKKQSLENKSIPPFEDTFHNHDECIKIQQEALDLEVDTLHDHDECIKIQQEALDLEIEEYWRSREDLSMYPQLKEYFEKKAMIEDKFYLESLNPSSPSKLQHLFDPFLDSP